VLDLHGFAGRRVRKPESIVTDIEQAPSIAPIRRVRSVREFQTSSRWAWNQARLGFPAPARKAGALTYASRLPSGDQSGSSETAEPGPAAGAKHGLQVSGRPVHELAPGSAAQLKLSGEQRATALPIA
jgi:hypothetical protein